MKLGSQVEIDVWSDAAARYEDSLPELIGEALRSYKRRPGSDSLTRLCESRVGQAGMQALLTALFKEMPSWQGHFEYGYVELRERLRGHIARQLQRRLIEDGFASGEMKDSYFSADLGL